MLLLAGVASASIFTDVDPEVEIDVDRSGNWGRAFPTDDGWDLFFAAGGEYYHVPMDRGLIPDLTRLRPLTGRSDLVDHGIARCDDGTWLHIGSTTEMSVDDSAWSFRYDADFTLTATHQLFSSEPAQVHRDMPVLCTDGFMATGFFDPDNFVSFRMVVLDEDGAAERVFEPEDAPICTGSSLFRDGDTVGIASFPGNERDYLHVEEYALPDVTPIDRHIQDLSPGDRAYWSQGYARVGDHHVLAYMRRGDDDGWSSQDGNVWLAVFNLDWRLEERVPISNETPPSGAMQPWVTFDGEDTLLVVWTHDLGIWAAEARIDRVAAGLDAPPDDTGGEPTGDTSDKSGEPSDTSDDTSGDTSGVPPGETGCGCGGGGGAGLLAAFAWGKRRRS